MAATPVVLQNTTGSITVYLQLASTGADAAGLTFADVTCEIKKPGAASFTTKALTGSNFTEFNNGFYEIDFTTTETDTLGDIYVRLTGATIKTTFVSVLVVSAFVSSPTTTTAPTKTAMFGYVFMPDGTPYSGASVTARILSDPTVLHNGTEGLVVSAGVVSTTTDTAGYFVLNLITGAQVEVFIPAANYRRSLTIPGVSTNLFDVV